jgi:protein transport protein SEC24
MVAAFAQALKNSLDEIPNDENRTLIGFLTVDTTLHFYRLDAETEEPQMMVMADLDDVYLPAPEDLLVNLTECRSVVETFLDKLPTMFQNTAAGGNALGSALQAALKLIVRYSCYLS